MTAVSEVTIHGVPTLSPRDTAEMAACVMDRSGLSAVPVCDRGQFVGVVSERDIAVSVVARGLAAASTQVGVFLNTEAERCVSDEVVEEVVAQPRRQASNRLPVVDRAGRFVGLLVLP